MTLKNGVITQNNGVIDTCLMGHGDDYFPIGVAGRRGLV